MKKTIFTISVNHSIDLITNSSSELFVLQGKAKDIVAELVKNVFDEYSNENPDYIDVKEYKDVINISEMSADELDSFFNYATGSYIWPAKKSDYKIPQGFTFDEVYEPDGTEPAWNGHIQYKVRNNDKEEKQSWGSFVTEENKEWFLNRFCPNRDLYFLYSLDENPNYEVQQKLEGIGNRYHLG